MECISLVEMGKKRKKKKFCACLAQQDEFLVTCKCI